MHVVLSPTAQRLGVADLSWAWVRFVTWLVCSSAFKPTFFLSMLLGLSAGVLKRKATRLKHQSGVLDASPW